MPKKASFLDHTAVITAPFVAVYPRLPRIPRSPFIILNMSGISLVLFLVDDAQDERLGIPWIGFRSELGFTSLLATSVNCG
jgi:hypothetical protein